MNKRIIVGIVIIALVAICAYYLLYHDNFVKKDISIVNIGVILPLTGEAADYGISGKMGIETAMQKINSSNTTKYKFEVYFEDSEGKPKNAISAFEKLSLNYNIPVLIGPISSPEVLALAPIVEKRKKVLLSPGASSPAITNAGDYIFRNVPSDIYEPKSMASYVLNVLKYKNIAIIYVNNDYGVGVNKVFSDAIIDGGGKIVESITYEREEKDFRTRLLKIKESKPEAIYFIGYKELGLIIKQSNELKIESQYLSNSLFEDPSILELAGDAAENLIFTTFPFDITSNDPVMKDFVANFELKNGKKPDGFAAASYEALMLIYKAVSHTGVVDSEGIKNGLNSIYDYNGIFGKISFDKNGDVVFPIKLKIVKNNKFININD